MSSSFRSQSSDQDWLIDPNDNSSTSECASQAVVYERFPATARRSLARGSAACSKDRCRVRAGGDTTAWPVVSPSHSLHRPFTIPWPNKQNVECELAKGG